MPVDYAILGGDARNAYLTRMLCANGCDARWIDGFDCGVPGVPRGVREELGEARAAVLNWPYPGDGEILSRLPSGAQVYFCGPAAPEGISRRLRSVNLWADEQLLAENAWLTAEGAISAAMAAGDASLRECTCMVIGWGRIGRALTEMLVGLSARVTVASRSERGRNGAVMRGAQSVATEEIAEALPGKKLVFSTPPARVLGRAELEHADRDALIVDLASPPYGVDLEAAQALNLRAWREPKLPGRYCPYSAARALMRAIFRAGGGICRE